MVAKPNEVDVVFVNIVKEYRRLGLAFPDDRIEYHIREHGKVKVGRALEVFRDKDPSLITTTQEKYFEGVLRKVVIKTSELTQSEAEIRETHRRLAREREIEEEIRREKKTTECEKAAQVFFDMAKKLAEEKDMTVMEDQNPKTGVKLESITRRMWKPEADTIQHLRKQHGFVFSPEMAKKNNIILDDNLDTGEGVSYV